MGSRSGAWGRRRKGPRLCTMGRCACEGQIEEMDNIVDEVKEKETAKKIDGWIQIEMTIDSGAVDTVIPPQAIPNIPLRETTASTEKRYYLASNNRKIPIRGRKSIQGYTDDGRPLKLEAEVSDVKRALGSVRRLCEKGNRVVFDPRGSYIENVEAGQRTPMNDNGKGYKVKIWVPDFTRQAKP